MSSAWDPPTPRWKTARMEVTVSKEGEQYVANYTFRFPGVDALMQTVQGRSYREFAEKLDKLPSPYFLHGRQLLWHELVTAGKDFEILKQSAEDNIRTGHLGEDCWTEFWPDATRWSRYKPHGPKKKREARKARIAALKRQKGDD